MDFYQSVGELGLGSRLKRLSDVCMTEVESVYSTAGLEFEPRWFSLFYLVYTYKPITVTEAAEKLGSTHPHVSLMAKEMVGAKLLSFKANPDDGRSRILVLTSQGKSSAAKMEPLWRAIRQSVEELIREHETHFMKALSHVEDSFRERSLSNLIQLKLKSPSVGKVRIVEYSPKLRTHFELLNREWLEKHFTVEPLDQKYFSDPKE